jgi:hypothetical protein
MVKRKDRDNDEEGPSTSGQPLTIGQQTSHIANKIVRGTKYAKLKHEKNKAKKKARAQRKKEIERAEELGIEPPPKPVPKVRLHMPFERDGIGAMCHACCWEGGRALAAAAAWQH